MNSIHRTEHWAETHHPGWLDFVRIALGLFLLAKGAEFAGDINKLLDLMSGLPFSSFLMLKLAHYVLFAYLLGGILLATGLLTRFACAINLPLIVAAIAMNFFSGFSDLSIAVLILALIVYFMLAGSGRWSLDWYVNKEYENRRHYERDFY